ncbi:hypothetical protein [Thalassotalea marina]|uniref:Lipoprotein n=1 Tax=Thalassotalea marina TaxID=1673741 RepID=A0A919EM42_9GAMM|nr:hypothetical protein [Thalassotalea marina]GHF97819.1 hypothetical protein GCM10017161_27610 [Thalassotalea marina]
MKKFLAVCFSLVFVASCASNGSVSHWHGEPLGAIIEKYGTPDSFLKMDDGNKVLEYNKAYSSHLAGNFCSLIFMVDRSNKISAATKQGDGHNCH